MAASTFGDISVDALDEDFSGQMKRIRLGALTLANVVSAPARISSGGGNLGPAGGWFLLLNERGTSRHSQRGRAVCLREGELTALRADERYQIELSGPNSTVVLHLPDNAHRIELDPPVAERHEPASVSLLTALMRRLLTLDLSSGAQLPPVDLLAMDIARLCWPARGRPARSRSMPAWEHRLREHVERNLGDPALSAASIGRCFGVSARFVHMVFARTGQTSAQFILGRRLEAAAAILRSNPAARVTDVALDFGFTDLSHFCHVFRRRFGTSARQFRQTTS